MKAQITRTARTAERAYLLVRQMGVLTPEMTEVWARGTWVDDEGTLIFTRKHEVRLIPGGGAEMYIEGEWISARPADMDIDEESEFVVRGTFEN